MSKNKTNEETKRITNDIELLLNVNCINVPLDAWDMLYKIADYSRIDVEELNNANN